MKKIRIGVMGCYRGTSMINYCRAAGNAEVVAICDKWEEGLERQKAQNVGMDIAYYNNFDDFIKHDMDAVVLANYATEHAPFAIRAMRAGKHVFSEVLPVQTLKEAVELVEAVEETGKIYAYGENYCYMQGPMEMRRLYREGKIGEFEYGEGEYVHNCEPIWPSITYGDRNHWRNRMYATYYCTHSFGPLVHITGLRPITVTGFEGVVNERGMRTGRACGSFGMEMVTFENGAIAKSLHGDLYKDSIWYSIYGNKGRMETAREDAEQVANPNDKSYALSNAMSRIYINVDEYSGEYKEHPVLTYVPSDNDAALKKVEYFGHGGSDYWSMYHFVEKILGNENADIIDVYEALDMGLCGLMAYRSILNGGVPVEIPNMRDKAVREKYRNDVACTDPDVAGEQLLPFYSKGNPDIDDCIYEEMKKKWRAEFESDGGYTQLAFTQSRDENSPGKV